MSDNEVPAPACTLLWAALLLTPAAGETQNGESHYWKKKVLFILESKVLTSWMWIFGLSPNIKSSLLLQNIV